MSDTRRPSPTSTRPSRRGPRRPSEAPELDEDELVAELRRRSWAWLHGLRTPVEAPTPLEVALPANDAGGHLPADQPARDEAAGAPAKRKRTPRREAAADGLASFRRAAWSWLKAPPAAAKRKRAPRAEPRPALAEDGLASFRRGAWSWLSKAAPAPAPAEDSARPPAKRKRAPRREAAPADAARALRRKAWWWLRPPPAPAPAEAFTMGGDPPYRQASPARPELPKRRRGKRDATLPEGVAELRRRAWAWFAPKATGEAAAGTHAPLRVATPTTEIPGGDIVRGHLKGVLEALIFASEHPLPARELARIAQADLKLVKILLAELVAEYHPRGLRLDEVAGGYVFRTSPVFAPFVREQVAKKPVKMSRAQIETLAIVAYRQPITRPEIDEVRGVDSGAVLKSLLERDLVRIIGKKDEPGRPLLYGTTGSFLEFFGMKALGDLPTLREFTELTDESKRAYEREMGEEVPDGGETGLMGGEGEMRRPAAEPAQVIDVAALEEDPTLEKEPEPSGEASAASGPEDDAPLEPRASASGPSGAEEDDVREEPQDEEAAEDEVEESDDEDDDEEDEEEDDDDDEEEDDEEEDDEEEDDEEEDDEDDEDDEDEDDAEDGA